MTPEPTLRIVPETKTTGGLRLYRGRWPSVTTILKVIEKSHLDDWKARVGEEEADRVVRDAQAFGNRVHAIAHKIATGAPVQVEPEMEPFAQAFRDFLETCVEEVLGAELTLVAEKREFAGTLDLYVRLKDSKGGGKAVVDLKTTKSLTRDHGLQTTAYGLLLTDNGHEVNRRLVVRIKKEEGAHGKYYVREYKDHTADARAFLAVLTVFYWQKGAQIQKIRAEKDAPQDDKPR